MPMLLCTRNGKRPPACAAAGWIFCTQPTRASLWCVEGLNCSPPPNSRGQHEGGPRDEEDRGLL